MYTQEEINLIVLSSFRLPYKLRRTLLCDFNSASPDFKNHKNLLIKTLSDGVYNKVEEDFNSYAYREKVLNELEKKGIKCVTYFSQSYPETLKNVYEPPIVLYCKGDTSLLKSRCFSVVGSRRTSPKILKLCAKISGEISKAFTIVSGLADGADCRAIEGALESGGKVISVQANGLDCVYPAGNENILRKVEAKGLVISEYLPDEKPMRHYFPFRNRIIAGLSDGTLVVSAGAKSGALITAEYALEYGREVFAFPYGIDDLSGEGCNELLKNGATLTRNVLDIFNEFGLDFNVRKEIPLSENERAVYEFIKTSGEAFLPEIADKLKKSVPEITAVVISLTIKQLVINLGGNRYSATI